MMPGAPLLRVSGLVRHFALTRRVGWRRVRETVRAVDGIDFEVHEKETVGLVGESGCGKSTAGRTILRLLTPTAGRVEFDGCDLAHLGGEDLRRLRRHMGVVFQDPMSALNPRMSVGDIVAEPLRVHRLVRGRTEALKRAEALLQQVGLDPSFAARYPHEFSGGQRQRIGIARAIATDPRMLVLDEPISALDVSVRAQVLNLLADLQSSRGLAYLLIAHDLSIVRHVCDRVLVMYLGVIVEEGPSEALFEKPLHPYTQALIASAPRLEAGRKIRRPPLEGDVPTPVAIPSGCRFRTRCPLAVTLCEQSVPGLREVGAGRRVACHLVE